MKQTKLIALTGMLSALSVVMLFLGSAISLFAYVMPLFTSLLMIVLADFSKKHCLIMFVVVSLISVFALPDKECPLTYVFFFGYYPIIRDSLEKIRIKAVSYLVKLLVFNAGIVSSQLICYFVLHIPFDDIFGRWGIAILLVLANLVFVVYERLIAVLCVLYDKKLKRIVLKLLK